MQRVELIVICTFAFNYIFVNSEVFIGPSKLAIALNIFESSEFRSCGAQWLLLLFPHLYSAGIIHYITIDGDIVTLS